MSAPDSNLPLIPRTLLFDNPERAQPKISPDATKIAYLKPHNGVMNIFVGSAGAPGNRELDRFVPVTGDTKRGIALFFWQADSRHLLYLQDEGGDENWGLYQADIETNETRNLTPFAAVQARLVALSPQFPDVALIALNHRDPRNHDLYRIDLQTGESVLLVENKEGFTRYVADNRLQVRAAQKMLSDGTTEVYVRETEADPWRVLLAWNADDTGWVVGFTPEDDGLYIASSAQANAVRLLQVELRSGQSVICAEDDHFDLADVLRHPITHQIEAVLFERARAEWTVMSDTVRSDFTRLLAERDATLSLLSRDHSDRYWTVSYGTDSGPTHFYLYDRNTGMLEKLFSDRPALEAYPLASMQPIRFTARDGLALQGYLTLPPATEPNRLPLILFVHGGPWARDSWRFHPMVQLLANRGYAVLQINYRGSSGYGKAHLNAGDREWAGKMHDDLLDGKAWAIAQGIADPDRVAIAGGSYGGYATLVGLAFTPEEFACGVDIVGPSNLNTLLGSIPPYWEPIKAMFSKRMGNDPAFLAERSPVSKADQIVRPLLIAQGANDPRVKISESDQIVEAMRAAGKTVEYIVFPDEGHGFRRPENNLYFTAKMEAFLAQHLGGRCEPFVEVPGASGEVR